MRLNNDIKDRVVVYLVEKAFPKTKEENLKKNARISLEASDLLTGRKTIYEVSPEYVRGSSSVVFNRKIKRPDSRYSDTQEVRVEVSFTYATKVNEWGMLVFDVDNPELQKKFPNICKDVIALMDFEKERLDYRRDVKQILSVVQSSTPLIDLIPECAEFFKTESHGVGSKTTLVPTAELVRIRAFLDRAEKEKADDAQN